MNSTQAEIFKRLEKIKSNRLTKKQELGAIEDAINEAKKELENNKTMLYDLISNFNYEIDDVIIKSADLGENLRTLLQEATMGYNEYRENYVMIVSEFEDLGIPFDNELYVIDDIFEEASSLAENLSEKLSIG